jgi:hypothetical protein
MYPHLIWALSFNRIPQWRIAAVMGLSEGSFSRRITGHVDFSSREKKIASKSLGFRERWLFACEAPPSSARLHSPELTGARV